MYCNIKELAYCYQVWYMDIFWVHLKVFKEKVKFSSNCHNIKDNIYQINFVGSIELY